MPWFRNFHYHCLMLSFFAQMILSRFFPLLSLSLSFWTACNVSTCFLLLWSWLCFKLAASYVMSCVSQLFWKSTATAMCELRTSMYALVSVWEILFEIQSSIIYIRFLWSVPGGGERSQEHRWPHPRTCLTGVFLPWCLTPVWYFLRALEVLTYIWSHEIAS